MVEWNRNVSRICDIGGRRVVSKDHKKRIFFRRELFFYDLFKKVPLIKTPELCSAKRLNLQTYFIKSERKDIFRTAKEWAGVHSYFMRNSVDGNRFFVQHDIKEVASYVSRNLDAFGKFGCVVGDRLSGINMNKNLNTLLHGDLQSKNMVTANGENYYFDFELGGVGHPGRDVASMIISNPYRKRELLDVYRENFDFDYSGFGEDINSWVLARASQLYVIFSGRKGSVEQRRDVLGKLFGTIENFVG